MLTLTTTIQATFQALAPERQLDIIYHGAALRFSELNKSHFLAQSKVQSYEAHYQTTLDELTSHGLPDDASFELHEDYILWHHWATVVVETQAAIEQLLPLVEQGLPIGALNHEGD